MSFKKVIIYIPVILFLMLLPNFNAKSEITGNASVWGGNSTNAFYVDSVGSTMISGIGLGLNYEVANSNWNYFLEMNYYNYNSFNERNFLNTSLGFNMIKPLDKDDINFLNINGFLSSRFDGIEYNIYDYWQPLVSINYYHYFSTNTFLSANYTPRMRFYSNYSEINYLENSVSLTYKTYFKTKTTLNINTSIMQKNYFNSHASNVMNPGIVTPKKKSDASIQKKTKWGKIIKGYSSKDTSTNMNNMVQSDISPSQFVFNGKISQNVTENVGLAFNLGYSTNLYSKSSDSLQGVSSYAGEEELFDDSYSFENISISPTLTVVLPNTIIGKLNYFQATKNYNYLVEIENEDQVLRKDDFKMLTLSFSRYFNLKDSFFYQIFLTLDYSYYTNNSNTYIFDYDNQDLYLTLQVQF